MWRCGESSMHLERRPRWYVLGDSVGWAVKPSM